MAKKWGGGPVPPRPPGFDATACEREATASQGEKRAKNKNLSASLKNLDEGLNSLMSDQIEMTQDGFKKACNEQPRATASNVNALCTITFSRCLQSQKTCEAKLYLKVIQYCNPAFKQ